ncbi:MAG: glycosyltransferase family 2 protein [Candidatus Moranbacteria bacterium]|nr:glycosyltransferase family 2 protein [Candidatus Moranbacteria bacterium]
MKLSIVIPAYNEEKYIARCLQSVVSQVESLGSRYDIEIIVVNNASVDRTVEIVKEFAGVSIVTENERGLTKARQAGFAASTGDLIANVDADTKLSDGWIEKIFTEFEKNEKLVALSGPFIYTHTSKLSAFLVAFWYRVGQFTHFINQYILKKGAMLQGGNFILRRSALEKIGGYDTSIDFWGEDTDIARRISKVGRVKFTFNFPIYTSARRFKKDGFIVAAWKYFINYVWVLIFSKPFIKEYEEIED